MKTLKEIFMPSILFIFLFFLFTPNSISQDLPRINKAFPDFTLSDHNGQKVSLSELKGKNVIIVFPRGKVADHWCQLCHYQYAELAKLEEENNIREKYNLEVLFVLPYSMEETQLWANMFPSQMNEIARWKEIPTENANPRTISFVNAVKEILPYDFKFDEENPAPLPFPILADENQELSMELELYTTFWDGYYNEQNEATTYILDKEGIVRFKYKSQETFDRPPADYLISFIENMMDSN